MLSYLPKENMGTSNLGWLESRFHFSFAQYYNPANINFGVLRVLNDDIIHSHSGFDTHPHKDMEIITYVIKGYLTHKDSMGNEETLKRGEVQYMSAGEGIFHSEHNLGGEDLRLLQMWIIPPQKSLPKLYGSYRFTAEDREEKLLNIVSSQEGNAPIKIHQKIDIYVSESEDEKTFKIEDGKQLYFVQIEGKSLINESVTLTEGDALEISNEKSLHVKPHGLSHFLFIQMNS